MIPRILIIGASLVKTKMFTILTTLVICSQDLITIMIDCPIQQLVSMDETQLACTSKSDLLKPGVFLRSFALFHSERKKPCGVPALYREA